MNQETDMKKCQYCAEMIKANAVKCRYCGTWLNRQNILESWTRDRQHGKLLGVCAGLAKNLNIHVTYIRLAFIIGAFFGWGILLYILLWLLMPEEDQKV